MPVGRRSGGHADGGLVHFAPERRRIVRHGPNGNGADLATLLAASPLLKGDTMPRGTSHEVTGLLLQDRNWLVVDVDGGGTWRLDTGWGARRLLGHRVRIVGKRDDFDLLAVKRIERI